MLDKKLYTTAFEHVTISAVELRDGGESGKPLKKKLTIAEFFEHILKWVNATRDETVRTEGDIKEWSAPRMLSPSCYEMLFSDIDWTYSDIQCKKPTPDVLIQTYGTCSLSVTYKDHTQFAFLNEQLHFEYAPMPSAYRLDALGDIFGDELVFKKDKEFYPLMVRFPGYFDGLGKLNYLLEPRDDNPITILHHSPQPYKGIGKQVSHQLWKLRQTIVDSLVEVEDIAKMVVRR